MKRKFSVFAMLMLSIAALTFVSCEKPDEPDDNKTDQNDPNDPNNKPDKPQDETPVFPEAVTEALEANGSYTLEIQPNMDWKIELKYEKDATGWFWIQDGNSQVYSVRGKAGDKAVVKVCAGEQTDFDKVRSCTLEMTMGEKTQTIATFTRGTVARTFELAYCDVEADGSDFVYADEGGYEYGDVLTGEKPAIPLEWIIRTNSFCRSIRISANFEWQLKSKPEWLGELSETGGKAGETVVITIEGDEMKYPLEDAEGELVFCAVSNKEAAYTYTVQIPGCKDMFEISGFAAETKANKEGQIWEDNMMGEGSYADVEVGISGNVMGLDNVKIYTFAYVVESQWTSYWDNSEYSTAWIKAALTADDEGSVLKDYNLNITVTPNEGEERKACVIAIPADKAPAEDYMFFPDGQNLDEQYADYVVTFLTQEGTNSEEGGGIGGNTLPEITFIMESQYGQTIPKSQATLELVTEENIESLATKYAKYDKLNIFDYYPSSVSATYILTYYPDVMQNMTQLSVPNFDPNDETVTVTCYPKNEWLTYEPVENLFSIWMTKPDETSTQNFGIIQLLISPSRSYTIICLPEL